MGISTHILDTTRGRPAADVVVRLEHQGADGNFTETRRASTDADGRVEDLVVGEVAEGVWRLHFDVEAYHQAQGVTGFYPTVAITFRVTATTEHHHVPLLLNPFGFSTYRGS
jgi:5-hydroxyisourate hydrolase